MDGWERGTKVATSRRRTGVLRPPTLATRTSSPHPIMSPSPSRATPLSIRDTKMACFSALEWKRLPCSAVTNKRKVQNIERIQKSTTVIFARPRERGRTRVGGAERGDSATMLLYFSFITDFSLSTEMEAGGKYTTNCP